MHAVPSMRRAKDLEQYDPNSEFALGGEEDGWTATHNDPVAEAAAAPEFIPDMEEASAGGKGKAEDDDDIPDIGDLELEAEQDEVRAVAAIGEGGGPRAWRRQGALTWRGCRRFTATQTK